MPVWPNPATILQPRTSGLEYMIGYIMIAPVWTSEGVAAGQVPADTGTDRRPKPMTARISRQSVRQGPSRACARAGWENPEDWRYDAKACKLSKDDGANTADKVEEWARMLAGRVPGGALPSALRAPAGGEDVDMHKLNSPKRILARAEAALLKGRADAQARARSWALRAGPRKDSSTRPGRPIRSGRAAGVGGRSRKRPK